MNLQFRLDPNEGERGMGWYYHQQKNDIPCASLAACYSNGMNDGVVSDAAREMNPFQFQIQLCKRRAENGGRVALVKNDFISLYGMKNTWHRSTSLGFNLFLNGPLELEDRVSHSIRHYTVEGDVQLMYLWIDQLPAAILSAVSCI